MKVKLPIYTPVEMVKTHQLMKSVRENSVEPLRKIKMRRYKAYLQHSDIGYFPNGKKQSFIKKVKDLFYRVKDSLTFDDFE